jgi:hypothetical protein
MSASHRLAALALAIACLAPITADAMDEWVISSTARLFPGRPLRDIDNFGGSIR